MILSRASAKVVSRLCGDSSLVAFKTIFALAESTARMEAEPSVCVFDCALVWSSICGCYALVSLMRNAKQMRWLDPHTHMAMGSIPRIRFATEASRSGFMLADKTLLKHWRELS